MSVEVLRLAFVYFIASSSLGKHVSLKCLFNDAQRTEWWLADVVYLKLQKPQMNMLLQGLSRAFLSCVDRVSFGLVDVLKLFLLNVHPPATAYAT